VVVVLLIDRIEWSFIDFKLVFDMLGFFPAFFKMCSCQAVAKFFLRVIFHQLQSQLGSWSAKEYLVSNQKSSKTEIFIDHDELTIDPLRIEVSLGRYFSISREVL
jgi:hypothetical protein